MSVSVPAVPARQEAPHALHSFLCVGVFLHSRKQSLLERNGWNFASTTEKNMVKRGEKTRAACSTLMMKEWETKSQTTCCNLPSKNPRWEGKSPDTGTTGSSHGSSCYDCCCHEAACRSDSRSHLWTNKRQILEQKGRKGQNMTWWPVTWGHVWQWHIQQWCAAFQEMSVAGPE